MATNPSNTSNSTQGRQQQLKHEGQQSSTISPTDPAAAVAAVEPYALPVTLVSSRARSLSLSSSITSTTGSYYPPDDVHDKDTGRHNRPLPTTLTTTYDDEAADMDIIPTFVSTSSRPLPVQNPRQGPTLAPVVWTATSSYSYPPWCRFPITSIPAFIVTDPTATVPPPRLSTRASPPTVDEPDTEVQTTSRRRCSNPGSTWQHCLKKTRPTTTSTTTTTCRNSSPATWPPSLPQRHGVVPIMVDYFDHASGDVQPSSRYIATRMDSVNVTRPSSEHDDASSGEQQAKCPLRRKPDSASSTVSSIQSHHQQQQQQAKVIPPETTEKRSSEQQSKGEDMIITTRENIMKARPDPDGIHAASGGPITHKKDKQGTPLVAPRQQYQQRRRRSSLQRTKSKSAKYSCQRSSKTRQEQQQKQVSPLTVMNALVGDGEDMGAHLVEAFCRKGRNNESNKKKARQARLPNHVEQPRDVPLQEDSDEGLCKNDDDDFKTRAAPQAEPPSPPSSKKQTQKQVYIVVVLKNRDP